MAEFELPPELRRRLGTVAGRGRPRLHLSGVVLPDGEHRDLWVVDGVIRTEPVRDARTVATGVWLLPGLVDAHCHVGLESEGAVPPQRAEEHALADRAAGALLLRDAGSPADTRWMDERDDLPRIIRAGRHIARPKRYLRNFAAEVEPEDLVAEVERQAARGDGWVKLVGDWIDRDIGDLAPLWPVEVARAGDRRGPTSSAAGSPRTSSASRRSPSWSGPGIDGIEHGTGLTEETTALMAERQVALVPTMVQLENFESYAPRRRGQVPRVRQAHPGPVRDPDRALRRRPRGRRADLRRHRRRRATCRTVWSERRSRPWPPSARPSTPWAPGPGGPGPGWAGRTPWSRAPRPIWWPSTPIRGTTSAVLPHPARVILRGVVVG